MTKARSTFSLIGSAAAPAIALLVIGYFAAAALTGANGLLALGDYRVSLARHAVELKTLQAQRSHLAHDVNLLDSRRVDPDMADELVRRNLGLTRPDEVIIPLP